ncbi:MAG: hypothetical protein JWP57_4270 [Spirosoma sp.]|nr:hypothetical protein [Spirosoma sp.]
MDQLFATRLKQARLLSKLSLRELSDQIDNFVSYGAIKKYEDGKMLPEQSVIIRLAEALGVKPDYFFRSSSIELTNIEFRKKSKLGAKEISSITEIVRDRLERYFEVEELLRINRTFTNPLQLALIKDIDEVEEHVLSLLITWELGQNPIPNVIEMLEDKGVKIVEIDAPDSFDGLSTFVDGVPVIVLNQDLDPVRKRFTALHELAHLIFSFSEDIEHGYLEKCCHRFASAMLVPKPVMRRLLGESRAHLAIAELTAIKVQYGISVQALIKRAYDLQIIRDHLYKGLFIWLTKTKNRKEEKLGIYKGIEKSYRFRQLIYRLAAEELVTLKKAANLGGIKEAELRDELDVII